MHLINGDYSHVFRVGGTNWRFGQIQFSRTMRIFTVQEVIWALEQNGWEYKRTRGDHRQFKCKGNRYVITVAGKLNSVIPIGTLKNIERLSGLCFAQILG